MTLYRERPRPFRAERITDATFDDPHPNPTHIVGVEYDPRERTASILYRVAGGVRGKGREDVGHVGDWICASRSGGVPFLCSDGPFREQFEEAPA